MTIVFFARRFYPLIGGVEKHVFEISKRLVSQGHKIIVVTENSNNLPPFETIKPGIEICRLNFGSKGKKNKFKIWKELWQNRELLQKAEVVHCHDVFFWYLPFRFLYPRKKVFTTFHGYENYPISKKAILVRKLSEILSFGNICIGDFIRKWYYTKPTYVSYGAVEVTSHQSHKGFRRYDLKTPSALFFGRLDEQTGIKTYNKAFGILKKKYPRLRLLVIGDGKYRRSLDNKIQAKEFQKNPERYFKQYRFAFVSRYLSILEAFAAKRLVFAVYDNPVKEDYLRMAPFAKFIIIAKDPHDLARKVAFFIEHPELEKKMIEGAYAFVQKQTWENMVTLYLKLWRV